MELRGSIWGEWVPGQVSDELFAPGYTKREALYEFDKWTRLEIHTKQVHISLNRKK